MKIFKQQINIPNSLTTCVLLITSISILSAFNHRKATRTPFILTYDTLRFSKPAIPDDNILTVEGVALGRLLFYDTTLSGDFSQSCGSCHKQEYSFSDGGKQYSVGIKGKEGNRNTMTLVNLAWQTDFFWDGRVKSLEELIYFPVTDSLEMNSDTTIIVTRLTKHKFYPKLFKAAFPGEAISFHTVSKAISQFLRTINIKSYSKRFLEIEKELKHNETIEKLQENSFVGLYYRTTNTCGRCHPGEGVGNTKFANNLSVPNAIYNTSDSGQMILKKFKVPTLINIKYSAPYMHDGSYKDLDEVINHYEKHIKEIYTKNPEMFIHVDSSLITLTEYDRKNLSAFFELFTDTSILTDKKYSNPFQSTNFKWDDFPYLK